MTKCRTTNTLRYKCNLRLDPGFTFLSETRNLISFTDQEYFQPAVHIKFTANLFVKHRLFVKIFQTFRYFKPALFCQNLKKFNSVLPFNASFPKTAFTTLSLNLKGLAVDAMTVFVTSPVEITYLSYTSTPTAVWVSMTYPYSLYIASIVFKVSASLNIRPRIFPISFSSLYCQQYIFRFLSNCSSNCSPAKDHVR